MGSQRRRKPALAVPGEPSLRFRPGLERPGYSEKAPLPPGYGAERLRAGLGEIPGYLLMLRREDVAGVRLGLGQDMGHKDVGVNSYVSLFHALRLALFWLALFTGTQSGNPA